MELQGHRLVKDTLPCVQLVYPGQGPTFTSLTLRQLACQCPEGQVLGVLQWRLGVFLRYLRLWHCLRILYHA